MLSTMWRTNVSLVQESVGVIRERIFSGRYRLGQLLPQTQIADELELSRTPLREALRILEHDGLVDIDTQGRARVVELDAKRLVDALDYRHMMQTAACRLLAMRGPTQLARVLEHAGNEASEVAGTRRYHGRVSRLHVALLEATGNGYLHHAAMVVRLTEELIIPNLLAHEEDLLQHGEHQSALEQALHAADCDGAVNQLEHYFAFLISKTNHMRGTTYANP